jgi:hypothetical protein
MTNRCLSSEKSPVAGVKAVLSCFNCGHGHVAKDCRRRPTYNSGAGRGAHMSGVRRDTEYRGGVGRDTDNLESKAKGWIMSGNDRRELSSNPMTTRRNK